MRTPLLLVVLLLAGCRKSASPSVSNPAENEVFELVSGVSLDSVAAAYARLDRLAYTVDFAVEELDEDGRAVAEVTRRVRRAPGADRVDETVLDSTSSGAFSDAASSGGPSRPSNPLPDVLPDDPAYASIRTRDHYAYEMRADTIKNGEQLRVAQATLHATSSNDQPIRYARYYLDSEGALVGIDVLLQTSTTLFAESSRVIVWLRRHASFGLLPFTSVSETTIRTPGSQPSHLRITQVVTDISTHE